MHLLRCLLLWNVVCATAAGTVCPSDLGTSGSWFYGCAATMFPTKSSLGAVNELSSASHMFSARHREATRGPKTCYGGDVVGPGEDIVFGTSAPLVGSNSTYVSSMFRSATGNESSGGRRVSALEIQWKDSSDQPFDHLGAKKRPQLYFGLKAAFEEINRAGGVCNRNLSIVAMDDGCNFLEIRHTLTSPSSYGSTLDNIPALQLANIKTMVDYGLFGFAGTYGSDGAVLIAEYLTDMKIPLVETSSGSSTLRFPFDQYVINLRPSYLSEAILLVNFAISGLYMHTISVFWQSGDFGISVLNGAVAAMTTTTVDFPLYSNVSFNASSSVNYVQLAQAMIVNGTGPSVIITACHTEALVSLIKAVQSLPDYAEDTAFLSVNVVSQGVM
ncbi:periplasmic binding protein-like I [Blyttiomyces helicus]|uniref:Periplasmic binding protein-like I n=1 Tax=Blyttiomyces helicus TaxID=388810 RepID=A0A4P9WPS8_9FUNG|nr:periplasmic binding protein-like I [Blyttiomyces helicus]|eukprot:RKO92826.1 periplasmic binding protein-like I [Blyttiomyces helicus]